MATITPVILPAKRLKSGKDVIRISIAHNGITRYISTDITVDPGQFNHGFVVKRPDATMCNLKIANIIGEYQQKCQELIGVESLTCQELVNVLTSYNKIPVTLSEVFEEYISTARIKDSTKQLVRTAVASLYKHFGPKFELKRLNYAKIMAYEQYLRNCNNCNGTIRTKMAIFSKIVKYAIKSEYLAFNVNPFSHYKYPDENIRDSWLSVDEIRHLRDIHIADNALSALRDYIMLSYYLGGINAIDLMNINFSKVRRTNRIKYIRTKTSQQVKVNPYVEFDVPDEAWPIVNRLIATDGKLGTPFHRANNLHDFIGQKIVRLRKLTGLDKLVFYSARKSFSQHAFELGINTGIIDYILGHKLNKAGTSLYNYIFVTPEIATNTLRMVLDNLK